METNCMVTKNIRETKGGFVMKIIMLGAPGSGKGTITKIVAQRLNLVSIDTGAMYRAVTLKCLQNNIDVKVKTLLHESFRKKIS